MQRLSILVPFRDDGGERGEAWSWLERYWHSALPDAELVVGNDDGVPFSKSAAVNDAARRARGTVFAIIDADTYLAPDVVRACARRADTDGSWFVPYDTLFRLTLPATRDLMSSDPQSPMRLYREGGVPRHLWEESATNEFGAMAQIVPRAAFWGVCGWDERFRGWGGEDHAFLRSLDTLYRPHLSTKNFVYHLWHPRPGTSPTTRVWHGQRVARSNYVLIRRYRFATGDPARMRRLIHERCEEEA